jgi:hypothetical protein
MDHHPLGPDAAPDGDVVCAMSSTPSGTPRGFTPQEDGHYPPATMMEPAWQATRALHDVVSDELRDLLRHPTFRLLPRHALVPTSPCPVCGDGALHTAGTLQTSLGRLLARACETCGLVDLDPRLLLPSH